MNRGFLQALFAGDPDEEICVFIPERGERTGFTLLTDPPAEYGNKIVSIARPGEPLMIIFGHEDYDPLPTIPNKKDNAL